MPNFMQRHKDVSEPAVKQSVEKVCDKCKGESKIGCTACDEKGFLRKVRNENVRCNICGGAATISPACAICSGTGSSARNLRFEDQGRTFEP